MTDVWNYGYFHIPNFILAALFYTLIGRLVLGMFVPEDWNNYLWRAFRRLTRDLSTIPSEGKRSVFFRRAKP